MPGSVKKWKPLSSDAVSAYLLILPFFLFFAVFVLYPILANLYNSLMSNSLNLQDREFVGLANFARIFRDKSFLRSIGNTFQYAAFSIAPLMALGFAAALLVNRKAPAVAAARAALIYPYVASMVSVSMVWLYLYEPGSGLFNKALVALGLPASDWLFDEALALPCLIAMNVWKNMGYVMIVYLAALQSVPQGLIDAAKVDGAGFLTRVRHVTLPFVRPVSFFLLATLSIECFKTFDQVRIMTNGGPVDATTTITHQIYIRAFAEFRPGVASAMSVVLFALVLAVTLLNLRFGGQLDRQ